MTNIILCGCLGKMGKIVAEAVSNNADFKIVAGIDTVDSDALNFPVYSNPSKCLETADVVLDFSRPNALNRVFEISKAKNIPVVLCTTGYTKEDEKNILNFSKNTAVFKSANMSFGINIMNSMLKKLASILYSDYDIEIIEAHHNQKVDSPSGTAVMLADTIKESIPDKTNFVYGRNGSLKRTKNEIGIHSIRGGSVVGEHDVLFLGHGETLEIKHTAISREVFAVGAVKACQFVKDKKSGLYSMDDIIKL